MANEWVRASVTLVPNVAPLHTITNAVNAIGSFLVFGGWELASWSGSANNRYYVRTDRGARERWRYEGDGQTQNCGIHIEVSGTSIRISAFLENTTQTGAQVDTNAISPGTVTTSATPYVSITFDSTAPNNYLMICGEDGFYIEAGRDASTVNLGHGMICCFAAITELNATKDAVVRSTSQGLPMDLTGTCKFTTNRNNRFVIDDGSSRNFTAGLRLYAARGVSSTTQPGTPANQPDYYIGNRDLIFGCNPNNPSTSADNLTFAATFGHRNSPEDGRYRISPILMIQEKTSTDFKNQGATSTLASNTVAAGTGGSNVIFRDIRHDRQILRLVVADYTLLPFANLTEAQTGKVYRLFEFNDGGRTANLGIEWSDVVVVPSLV